MFDFFSGIWAKIAAIGGVILAILLAILRIEKKGEAAGAAKVEAKQAQAVQKAQEQANVVSDQVSKAPDGSAATELESKWTH